MMDDGVEQFIERAGVMWEADGLPRIAGRIFGLTLLSEEALSLDQIAERLGVSKASVSTDTRLLERMGFVDRISMPGDRKDYYQSNSRSFERAIGERIRRMQDLQQLLESGRELAKKSPVVRERLDDHHLAFCHVTKALETALAQLRTKYQRVVRKTR